MTNLKIILMGLSFCGSNVIASEHWDQMTVEALEKRFKNNKEIGCKVVVGQWIEQCILLPDTDSTKVEALKNKLLANETLEDRRRGPDTPWTTFCLDMHENTGELSSPGIVTGIKISISEGKAKSGDFVTISQPLQSLKSGTIMLIRREVHNPNSKQGIVEVERITVIREEPAQSIIPEAGDAIDKKLLQPIISHNSSPSDSPTSAFSIAKPLFGSFVLVASFFAILYKMGYLSDTISSFINKG